MNLHALNICILLDINQISIKELKINRNITQYKGGQNIWKGSSLTRKIEWLLRIYCIYVLSRSVVSDSLQPNGLSSTRLLCPWGFSRQEYWSGLPCLPSGDLPNPGIEPRSPTLQVDSLQLSHQGSPIRI